MSKLPRERLAELIERSGISQRQIAKQMGYEHTSAFNRYVREATQGDRPIPYAGVIAKLIPILRGRGEPPITLEDLLACSDVKEMPKPVVRAFSAVVDDGDGFLAVKYRVEPDTFVRVESSRSLGASRIGVTSDYPQSAQFAVVVLGGSAAEQLHCVDMTCFSTAGDVVNKRVVYGALESADLMEVLVGRVVRVDGQGSVVIEDSPPARETRLLGVVIGSYKRE